MAAPVGSRGAGYGLDAELARKAQAKYNPELEAQAQAWIEAVTGQPFSAPFADYLKDGVALCNLANGLQPGIVRRVNTSRMPFKQMENITAFLQSCRTLGVAEHDLFETVDLFEQKDLGVVVNCLHALGRASHNVRTFSGPYLGPREATSNPRQFSAAQRKSAAVDAGMTKLSMGSSQTMQRSHVDTSRSVAFGAEKAGTGVSGAVSRWNMGSSQTMERPGVSTANDIAFGAQQTAGANVPSAAPAGSNPYQAPAPAAQAKPAGWRPPPPSVPSPTPAPAAAAAPAGGGGRPKFCPECGTAVGASTAKFCSECGNRL